MKPIKVGLLGLGVVGGGTWDVLAKNAGEIARRAGRRIDVAKVAVRDVAKARRRVGQAMGVTDIGVTAAVGVTNDPYAVVRDPDIDIVVELIGGEGLARELVLAAIAAGKHVVTANKALLAKHGNEIFAAARAQGVMVAFEGAVAGGIPIIKAIREGLTANHIEWVAGIINGTTNYILSAMRARGLSFSDALAEAQRLGYAEADPTFDVDGVDAAHKLTLLASLAFGIPVQFERAHIEGIRALEQTDIALAERLGYRIKLLGVTKLRTADNKPGHKPGIELRVHPALIPASRLIANVEGAMNAVLVRGDAVGATLYYGQGAGEAPTASAVVADLVDVTRLHTADPGNRVPHLAFQPEAMMDTPILPMDDVVTSYYLRLRVADQSGVLADVARILADADISIDAMIQEPATDSAPDSDGEPSESNIIFLTHEALERDVNHAIARIEALPVARSTVTRLRMESLA